MICSNSVTIYNKLFAKFIKEISKKFFDLKLILKNGFLKMKLISSYFIKKLNQTWAEMTYCFSILRVEICGTLQYLSINYFSPGMDNTSLSIFWIIICKISWKKVSKENPSILRVFSKFSYFFLILSVAVTDSLLYPSLLVIFLLCDTSLHAIFRIATSSLKIVLSIYRTEFFIRC